MIKSPVRLKGNAVMAASYASQHQVAKEYHDRGPRINLTFRSIFPEPQGHRPGTKLHFTGRQADVNTTN